jgi:hypothetical protein
MPEPYDARVSRTVPRGGVGGNAASLADQQTAAAISVSRSSSAQRAAAAAELVVIPLHHFGVAIHGGSGMSLARS